MIMNHYKNPENSIITQKSFFELKLSTSVTSYLFTPETLKLKLLDIAHCKKRF